MLLEFQWGWCWWWTNLYFICILWKYFFSCPSQSEYFENLPGTHFSFPGCWSGGNFSRNPKVDFAGTANCTGKLSFERIISNILQIVFLQFRFYAHFSLVRIMLMSTINSSKNRKTSFWQLFMLKNPARIWKVYSDLSMTFESELV